VAGRHRAGVKVEVSGARIDGTDDVSIRSVIVSTDAVIGVVIAEFCPRILYEGDAQGGGLGPCIAFDNDPLGGAGS
jgi:hypothetical protein